jgi:hypothetical protein
MGEKKKALDDKSTNYYEARWYLDETNKDKYKYHEFSSKKAMHNFYEKHKKNKGKFNYELTYRNKYGEFLKDISFDDTDYDPTEKYDKDDEKGMYLYNFFGRGDTGDFYEMKDVIKMIDMAIEGTLKC